MRSTLFYIPHELFGVPVFGMGWLLGAWIVVSVVLLLALVRRQGWNQDTASYIPFMAIVGAAILFLLPQMGEVDSRGQPLGLPIRGFGVMLMLATVAGVGLGTYRAWQMGIDPELMYTLAFWMFIAGIAGARGFYILQYWDEFQKDNLLDTLKSLVNVTNGGLVVYGSVLAAVPVAIWFLRSRNLPVLAIGDIIAPSMVIGLALGRVGCFLNGCCFGGVCLAEPLAVTFPGGSAPNAKPSPPYLQHLEEGWRSGVWLTTKEKQIIIGYALPGGPAEAAGVKAGDAIHSINGSRVTSLAQARSLLHKTSSSYELATADARVLRWTVDDPPPRSVPVHPAQLYAAIDAGLLALLLWVLYPFRRRDGEVFALLITIHPISRFLLEMIRSDEAGQFGTELTISQWLSIGILAFACWLWFYIEQQPRGSALPRKAEGLGARG